MSNNIMEYDILLGGDWQRGKRHRSYFDDDSPASARPLLDQPGTDALFHDRMRSCEGEASTQCAVDSYSSR